MRRVPPDRSVGKLCAGLPRQGFHHCGDQFLQTAPLGDASGVSDVCAGYALWDLRSGLELLRRGQWLNRFDGPAPA